MKPVGGGRQRAVVQRLDPVACSWRVSMSLKYEPASEPLHIASLALGGTQVRVSAGMVVRWNGARGALFLMSEVPLLAPRHRPTVGP